jgi:hypothetical protein
MGLALALYRRSPTTALRRGFEQCNRIPCASGAKPAGLFNVIYVHREFCNPDINVAQAKQHPECYRSHLGRSELQPQSHVHLCFKGRLMDQAVTLDYRFNL